MGESKEVKKLSYEELENVAVQLQHKTALLENQMKSFNAVAFRLNYLFQVLAIKDVFSSEFISKCAKEIEDTLTIDENVESTTQETKK